MPETPDTSINYTLEDIHNDFIKALSNEAPELFYYMAMVYSTKLDVAIAWDTYKNNLRTISQDEKEGAKEILNYMFEDTIQSFTSPHYDKANGYIAEFARTALIAGHETWHDVFEDLSEDSKRLQTSLRDIFSSFLINGTTSLARAAAFREKSDKPVMLKPRIFTGPRY